MLTAAQNSIGVRLLALLLCFALVDVMPAWSAPHAGLVRSSESWPGTLHEFQAEGHIFLNVQLRNGHRVKGRLAAIQPEFCILKELGKKVIVPYRQIDSVAWQQNAFSHGAKVALIALAIGAVALILVGLELRKA